MLTVDNATAFLLEHDLIDREWIIGGELMVQSAARRHRNLRVEGPDGAGYLIKQADGLAHGDHQSLDNEASFLEYCHNEPGLGEVARMVPRVVYRDRERSLHAQELVAGASSLFTLYHASRPEQFPIGPSRTLGEGLGTIHHLFGTQRRGADPRLAWLSRHLPQALRQHRATPAGLATLTPGTAAVLRILEDEGLRDRVAALGSEWCPETVIHGDLKFDNVLVRSHPGPQDEDALELFLVDWEFVQFGDPAWDLAGALHDYLMLWTSSMPIGPDLRSEEMIDQARYPLATLHEAMRAFWEAYQTARGLGPESSDLLIRRAVAFTAARLVQAAFERSLFEDTLPAQAVILLQVSANVLADRELARLHLFGIPRRTTLW
jgi:aminoglycoside phosphotransferase (APT) family kinase protein